MDLCRRPAVRTFAAAALAVGSVTLAASCAKPAARHAAEPATAPPASATPAGTVRTVGASAEGAVFDARTGLLAVAVRNPDRLLLIDGRTLAVRRSVPLPGHARHLQLFAAGGPVLVPAEDANRLVEVSLPDGRVTTSVPVGQQPHDAAPAAGGRIAVGNEFSGTVSIVVGGQVQRIITGLVQPGGVVDAGVIDARPVEAVVDVHTYQVSTYDPSTGKRLARKGAGKGPTHAQLAGPNRLAVADTRGDAVLTFSVTPLRQTGRLALAGAPYGIATDAQTHTVWVTLTARNEVVGLDVTTAVPRVIARYPTVAQPDTVAVAPGSRTVWVVGARSGQVQRITR